MVRCAKVIRAGGLAAIVFVATATLAVDVPIPGKVTVVKPGKLAKLVAKSAGDQSTIDIVGTPAGPNGVTVVYELTS